MSKTPSQAPGPWRINTFGGFQINQHPDLRFRTRKTDSLVALLALRPGTLYLRDSLASQFWPDSRPDSARQSLRMALTNIRSILGKDCITTDRDRLGFNPDQVTSDIADFENLSNHNQAKEALDLVIGPFLPDLEADWITAETHRIHELVAETTVRYCESLLDAQDKTQGIQTAKRILEMVGCREDLHIAIMKLYVASGTPSLAIAQYETLETQLNDLWGEPPSAAAQAILESAPKQTPKTRPQQPADLPGLIGRQQEVQSLVQSFLDPENTPLITLVGTGGSGKTTVAQAVARQLQENGVRSWFIDLTATTNQKTALGKIIADLGLPTVDPAEATSAIAYHLSNNPGVLILDNLEQLTTEAKPLIESLRNSSPDTPLLLTSRTPTQAQDEQKIPVSPLATPTNRTNLEETRQSPAVRLFEQQATIANPSFALTTDNAAAVVELCRQLDGLPLALKLAASRIIVRSPAQILATLQTGGLDLIKSQNDEGHRHNNLRSTVEWSLNLLTPAEQEVALNLSLLHGRFNDSAAQAMSPKTDALPILETLINASLLNADPNGDRVEFWMYETVRNTLVEIAKQKKVFKSGMERLLQLTLDQSRQIEENNDLPAWQKLRHHLANTDNVLAALDHVRTNNLLDPKAAELAVQVADAFIAYGLNDRLAPHLETFFNWPAQAIPDTLRGRVGTAWVNALANKGDSDDHLEILKKSVALTQQDPKALLAAHSRLAVVYKAKADYTSAKTELDWVLKNVRPDDHPTRAWAFYSQALVACCLNKREESLEIHQSALAAARQTDDDPALLIRILFDLGSELANQGRPAEAVDLFEEAIVLSNRIGSAKLEGLTRWQYADALLSMDKPAEALKMLQESIRLVYRSGYIVAQKWIFLKAGQALSQLGHQELAIKLLAKGAETRAAESRPLAAYEQEDLDRITTPLKADLGDSKFKNLWFQGKTSDWPELWDEFKIVQP